MKKTLRILYWCLVILILTNITSCRLTKVDSEVTELPTDTPLAEYILGSWSTEHIYLSNGNEEVYFGFDITFVDYDTIEIVTKEDGDPMDITISQYHFIDSGTIFIDNKRLRGDEIWQLERDAQKLIIRITIEDTQESSNLVLRRN